MYEIFVNEELDKIYIVFDELVKSLFFLWNGKNIIFEFVVLN